LSPPKLSSVNALPRSAPVASAVPRRSPQTAASPSPSVPTRSHTPRVSSLRAVTFSLPLLAAEDSRRAEEIDEAGRDPEQQAHQHEPRRAAQPSVQDVAPPQAQDGGNHQREPHPAEGRELPEPTAIRLPRSGCAHTRAPKGW